MSWYVHRSRAQPAQFQLVFADRNLGDFSFAKNMSGDGPQELLVRREDFKSTDNRTLEWSKIATFEVTMIDLESKAKLDLASPKGHTVLQAIKLVD